MAQYDFGTIDPTATSGTELASLLDQFRTAIESSHLGFSRPSYATSGIIWINDTHIPWQVNLFDGTNDDLLGYLDPSASVWMPAIGGGVGSDISTTTTDLGAHPYGVIDLSVSSATITNFGTSAAPGTAKFVRFGGQLTIVASGNLLTPSGQNIITAAGDQALCVYLGSNVWTIFTYFQANSSGNVMPPGVTFPFAGFTAPPGFLLATGQAVSRTTYVALFNAVAIQTTGNFTSGSLAITGVANTANMAVGMPICGLVIPSGATIASISGTTVNLSAGHAATANSTGGAFQVCPWGVGDGSTTFNVPNIIGRVVVGLDTGQVNITTASVNFPILGGQGGHESFSMSQAQLPNVNFTFTATNTYGGINVSLNQNVVTASAILGGFQTASGTSNAMSGASIIDPTITLPSYTPAGHAASGGTGASINLMPPFLEMPYIIKT